MRTAALAQRYEHEHAGAASEEADAMRASALAAAKRATELGQREWLKYLWDPNHPGKMDQLPNERENDLEIFYGDPSFRTLLGDS